MPAQVIDGCRCPLDADHEPQCWIWEPEPATEPLSASVWGLTAVLLWLIAASVVLAVV